MDADTANILRELNNEFYAKCADSFSATRQHHWDGWERVLDLSGPPDRCLDLACGNLRFQKYVTSRFPGHPTAFHCVDSCEALLDESLKVDFQKLDIVESLMVPGKLASSIAAPPCSLTTTFGFMHHVPTQQARAELLRALVAKTEPGGCIAVSFWCFMRDGKRAEKARESTTRALETLEVQLDEGDYLIGWNALPGVFRYCHSFEESEIDELISSAAQSSCLLERFESDGRNGVMNTYIVLKRY